MGNKIHGKPLRVRASRLQKEDCGVFCLSLAFRDVLLDISERLEWTATWVDDDGDRIALTDEQYQIIEQGLEGLTMPCEIIVNNNVTVEPPAVNVNVNGGGGNCLPFPLPEQVRPDGTTIETVCLPVDPDNPSGDYAPVEPDYDNLEPPPGWIDWQQFIDAKCRAANYMIDALIGVVDSIDEAENRVSVAMEIVQLIIQFIPVPAQKTQAWNKILKWVETLLDFVDDVEGVWDWAQSIIGKVEEKRNELVCLIYSAPDSVVAAAGVAAATVDDLILLMTAAGVQGGTQSQIIEFWNTIINDIVPRAYDYEWVLSIPDSYQAPYNCASCGGGELGGGWILLPVQFDNDAVFGGSGGVTGFNVTSLGSYLRLSATADSPNDIAIISPAFKCPEASGLHVYGWHVDNQNLINVQQFGVDELWGGTGVQLCDHIAFYTVPTWCIRSGSAQFELDTGIDTNVPDGAAPGVFQAVGTETYWFGMRFQAAIAGSFSQDVKLFLICRAALLP